jgi:GPH family glycoside/pentoside/hexuronide:cation symporter
MFMGKVGQFAGAFFIGFVLSLTGYLPSTTGNLQQPDSAIFGIRLLIGLIPSIFYLASAVIIRWYPLTEAKCREMLERIR